MMGGEEKGGWGSQLWLHSLVEGNIIKQICKKINSYMYSPLKK